MTVRKARAGLWMMVLAAAATSCIPEKLTPASEEPTSPVDPTKRKVFTTRDAGQNEEPPPPTAGKSAVCPAVGPTTGTAAPGAASIAAPGGVPQTFLGPTVQSEKAPPPITGGTMLTSKDGSLIVAADPERDQVYFVDVADRTYLHTRKLNGGDQPGRIVEDAAGRFHTVLRGGHAIASMNRELTSAIKRREVCALPRGIAYDAAHDQLHIACAEGKLVTLNAAPYDDKPVRTLELGTDLRDVIARDGKLFVTRFRAAQLLVLNEDGSLQETRMPASFGHDEMRTVPADSTDASACGTTFVTKSVHVEAQPTVAWRAIDVPSAGVTMLHQRAQNEEIQVTQGGYGSGSCGSGIVQTSVTSGLDTQAALTANLSALTLAVDVAASPTGDLLALVAPGNHGAQVSQLWTIALSQLSAAPGAGAGGGVSADVATVAVPGAVGGPCTSGNALLDPQGQATSVTFTSDKTLVVQEREPAAISFYNVGTNALLERVSIESAESRADTGHELFHLRTGAGVACASCHPEAGDDGHVWTFASIGPRRTQTIRGGVLGTEPFHWNGDMADFSMLMREVFVGRMSSGFMPSSDQTDALSHWIDRQPALHADSADMDAAARGKELFESSVVGCTNCHSGQHLTNNQTVSVGTGANLQVPSLKGVRFRAPLMHDGCAANIKERLTNALCGGGDKHGHTSQLSDDEVNDLTAYVETL